MLQDLLIAYQQLLLLTLCKPVAVILIACMQVYILFDAMLYRKAKLRMEIGLWHYFRGFRSFMSSAKEMGLWRFVVGASLVFTAYLALFFFRAPVFSLALLLQGALVGIFSFFSFRSESANAIFRLEFGWLLHRRKKTKGSPVAIDASEKCHFLSPDYPLLRRTEAFEGEKEFSFEKPKAKPHVVILFLESFRAKEVSALGGKWGATPRFDALAKEGVLFSRFYAERARTHRALIASLFGIPADFSRTRLRTDLNLIGLPHVMREEGYQTAYFHNGDLHFDQQLEFFKRNGFEKFVGKEELLQRFPHADFTSWGVHDEYLMRHAADFLEGQKEPTFLSLLTMTNHHPWLIPKEYPAPSFEEVADRTYRRHLQTMHYSDWALGLFIDLLKQKGVMENCLLLILGDHGQPMGRCEPNDAHYYYLHEEVIHVPLLLLSKGLSPALIPTLASQVDLPLTVMDLLGISAVHHSSGRSLMRKKSDPQIFFSAPYGEGYLGCRKGDKKVLCSPLMRKEIVFDLSSDPEELAPIPIVESRSVYAHCDYFLSLYQENRFAPKTREEPPLVIEGADESFLERLEGHTTFSELYLTAVLNVADGLFPRLAPRCKGLRTLALFDCPTLTDRGLLSMIESCPNLRKVDLRDCLTLSDAGIVGLLERCENLESLNLKGVTDLTPALLKGFEEIRPKLGVLHLLDAPCFDDAALETLLSQAPNLHTLSLNCERLTDAGILAAIKKCERLEQLFLKNPKKISTQSLETFKQSGIDLKLFL